jgi:hypothetical protein
VARLRHVTRFSLLVISAALKIMVTARGQALIVYISIIGSMMDLDLGWMPCL